MNGNRYTCWHCTGNSKWCVTHVDEGSLKTLRFMKVHLSCRNDADVPGPDVNTKHTPQTSGDTVPSTLHTMQSTLHTLHSTLHTMQSTLHTMQRSRGADATASDNDAAKTPTKRTSVAISSDSSDDDDFVEANHVER